MGTGMRIKVTHKKRKKYKARGPSFAYNVTRGMVMTAGLAASALDWRTHHTTRPPASPVMRACPEGLSATLWMLASLPWLGVR